MLKIEVSEIAAQRPDTDKSSDEDDYRGTRTHREKIQTLVLIRMSLLTVEVQVK